MSYKVFIYCGGKCGRTTLDTTFTKNNYKTIKIHSNLYYKNVFDKNGNVFDLIDKSCINEKIYIIDSYRTPIERKISSFFQNIQIHLPNYLKMTTEEIINFFNQKLIYELEEYHPINEVLKHYNIPLFNIFKFEKGM